MNRKGCGWSFSRWSLIGMFVGVLLVSGEVPLLANPAQSGQTSTASQRGDDPLPDATQPQDDKAPPQPMQTPSGAAGAKNASVKGSPAAQPAGAAVAPAKQHGHRSLLIKVGLLAGAGVALGSVIALSAGSPARPPGTGSSTHP
jgi:hypothetical protein